MSIKTDLLKEIDAKVARKKELAQEIAIEKTVAYRVSKFFIEVEKMEKVDPTGLFISAAMQELVYSLRKIDRNAWAVYKPDSLCVEIHWSKVHADKNNIDPIQVMDAATAHFECAFERM